MKRVIGRRAIKVRSATSDGVRSEITQQPDLENGEDSTSFLTEDDDDITTTVGDAVCSECETGGILDT